MSLLEEAHPAPPPSINPLSTNSNQKTQPPIQSFTHSLSILDTPTELLVQTFDDRILVVVTQNGKMGCLTQASLPPHAPLPPPPPQPTSTTSPPSTPSLLALLPPPPPSLLLTPLLGTPPNPIFHELLVAQISTMIFWSLHSSQSPRRNVVVGLSLKVRKHHEPHGGSGCSCASDDDVGGHDEEEIGEGERALFEGIMELVSCWSGPS